MKKISQTAKNSLEKLSKILQDRLGEQANFANQIQEDPETKALLFEIVFVSKKALFWIRKNGSISSVNGTRLLLMGGGLPKTNPPLSTFIQKTT